MRLLQDGLVAMLAAIGLATILWMIANLFLRTKRDLFSRVTAVITAQGAGEGLEYAVHTLAQQRYEQGTFGRILVVDCGLSQEGLELAGILACEEECVSLCAREELADYFR